MATLFDRAVYVNRSTENVLKAKRLAEPLIENKRWVTGEKLWLEAKRNGNQLPIVFSHFVELTFWAIATDIKLSGDQTFFSFDGLKPIVGRERCDLTVVSSGRKLPNRFIKSYALVFTPAFLLETA